MGEAVIPAEPPSWARVEEAAVALLARTKDLQLATLLLKARVHLGGAAGLFEAIGLVRRLLERHWETLHPQLDPEDGLDPALRVNALAELTDRETVLAPFRGAEVASARGVGRVCVEDLERAAGASDGAPEGWAAIDAVLERCDAAALAALAGSAAAAAGDLAAMEVFLAGKLGARAPSLSPLAGLVRLVATALSRRTGARDAGADAATSSAGGPAALAHAPGAAAGAIRSRADALAALDGVCAYFDEFEPSSPIPILLRRSKGLVAKSFVEIVRDLAPEALAGVEALQGRAQ
jgi:type VI secretion system protein ImpA